MSSSPALLLFYFLATISIWLGLVSLRCGLRFVLYLRAELAKEGPGFAPFVTVFVPCRGIDEGLKENIGAIFAQDYPQFEIIFVSDRAHEPPLAIIEAARISLRQEFGQRMRFVIAAPATDSGQKVQNRGGAIRKADPQ